MTQISHNAIRAGHTDTMKTTAATRVRRWLPAIDLLILLASSSLLISIDAHGISAKRCTRCAFITSSAPTGRAAIRPRHIKLYSVGSSTDSTSSENRKNAPLKKKRGKSEKNINVNVETTSAVLAAGETSFTEGDEDLDDLFAALSAQKQPSSNDVKLVDFIEQNVGIQTKKPLNKSSSPTHDIASSQSASTEDEQEEPAVPFTAQTNHAVIIMEEQPPPSVTEKKGAPYNVVCTHITADFDTLASAIGLAKLWSMGIYTDDDQPSENQESNKGLPTYVVLPRGAHPDVSRFLSLHKHLFPIRSLKSLPGIMDDASTNPDGLQRVGLVDAQRRDRLGPADILLDKASKGVTIVDHHVDAESDIDSKHYIVENVGSVSTMIAERLKKSGARLTEAEATVLALGIHGDTGSLVYDSTVRALKTLFLCIIHTIIIIRLCLSCT